MSEKTRIVQVKRPCECVPTCRPQTEWIDGMEFQVSVWCKTPQDWFKAGSWLRDPEGLERIKKDIKEATNLDPLAAILDYAEVTDGECRTFWGSHGCDLDKDHGGIWHVCGPLDDPCMAVMEWGADGLIPWNIDEESSDLWQPWGLTPFERH